MHGDAQFGGVIDAHRLAQPEIAQQQRRAGVAGRFFDGVRHRVERRSHRQDRMSGELMVLEIRMLRARDPHVHAVRHRPRRPLVSEQHRAGHARLHESPAPDAAPGTPQDEGAAPDPVAANGAVDIVAPLRDPWTPPLDPGPAVAAVPATTPLRTTQHWRPSTKPVLHFRIARPRK